MNRDDEQAIFEELEAFAAAWSSGDAHLAASFCTDDCVRVGAFGDRQQGRAGIEAAYVRLFSQGMPGATIRQERGSVRMLTPEYAVWQGGIEIFGPDGTRVEGVCGPGDAEGGRALADTRGASEVLPGALNR